MMRKFLFLGVLCATACSVSVPVEAQPAPAAAVLTAQKSGFELLLAAKAAIVTPHDYERNKLPPAEKLAHQRASVAANSPALILLRQALARGIELPTLIADQSLDPLTPTREMARHLSDEAAVRAADGDALGAAQSSLDALELGAQTSRGTVIYSLSGFAVAAIARRSLEENAARLDATQSRQIAADWERIGAQYPDFAEIMRSETETVVASMRANMKDFDDPMKRFEMIFEAKGEWPDDGQTAEEAEQMLSLMKLSLDDIEADFRAMFERAAASAQKPYFAAAQAAPIRGTNYFTDMVADSLGVARRRFSFERNNASNRLLIGALQLRAVKLGTGAYPATFDAGTDPFSPALAPLIYRREGESYLLYSVGPDGIDDNGAAIQTITTDRETGAKEVSKRLEPNSTGDITAPVL